ncbi:MAG: GNAT family N-acetyltransferase [Patescibacteria group bacterium]
MAYKIEFLPNSDIASLKAFHKTVYRPSHILLRDEFLEWYTKGSPFYKNSTFGEKSQYPILVARNNRVIVGQWICQPSIFNFYGQTFSMIWLSNFLISPDWRHRGLGGFFIEALLRQQLADIFGANMITPEVAKLMTHYGYCYTKLDRYLVILSPEALELVRHNQDLKIKKRIKDLAASSNNRRRKDIVLIKQVAVFGDSYDHFWVNRFAKSCLGTARTAAFLNWRYFSDPFLRYRCFVVADREDILGLIILRVELIRGTRLRVCRLVEFFSEQGVVEPAIDFIVDYARRHKCVFIDYHNLYSGFDKEWFKAGALKNGVLAGELPRLTQPPSYENFIINAVFLNKSEVIPPECFLDWGQWYTTSGDADQDRKNFS